MPYPTNKTPDFTARDMGNFLESDGTTSESEVDPVTKCGVRTAGDGMEASDRNATQTATAVACCNHDLSTNSLLLEAQRPEPRSIDAGATTLGSNLQAKNIAELPIAPRRELLICSVDVLASSILSPKELPPRNLLIPLRPLRKTEEPTGGPPSTSYAQFTSAPVVKPKDPKFVPYEPYKGAVRSMTVDGTSKSHSRHEPGSSSSSVKSATIIGGSPAEGSPSHNSSNSNTTLLKERLRMAEKDISELQAENARLKRLFVDSMAGPVNTQLSYDSTTSSITAESYDNLADEIEVWRSKFLSSCVLVEQLTKENQDLKDSSSVAVQLFKDIKNNTVLTPNLFEQINSWTQLYQQSRTLASRDSFNSLNDYDDDGATEVI